MSLNIVNTLIIAVEADVLILAKHTFSTTIINGLITCNDAKTCAGK